MAYCAAKIVVVQKITQYLSCLEPGGLPLQQKSGVLKYFKHSALINHYIGRTTKWQVLGVWEGKSMMEVREIPAEATYGLRSRILRPGLPLEQNHYPADGAGIHFGLFEGERLLSIVTAHPEENSRFPGQGHWRIRGMATELEFQGRGLGLKVLLHLLAWGRVNGIPLFWCNAREKAIPFYARQGFKLESELFELPGIGPHKVMRIDL